MLNLQINHQKQLFLKNDRETKYGNLYKQLDRIVGGL